MRFRFKNFTVYQDSKVFCKSCREIINGRSVPYEVVAGFDLALLCGMLSEETNEKVEAEGHELVKS